jgi:hypothetical protein
MPTFDHPLSIYSIVIVVVDSKPFVTIKLGQFIPSVLLCISIVVCSKFSSTPFACRLDQNGYTE